MKLSICRFNSGRIDGVLLYGASRMVSFPSAAVCLLAPCTMLLAIVTLVLQIPKAKFPLLPFVFYLALGITRIAYGGPLVLRIPKAKAISFA